MMTCNKNTDTGQAAMASHANDLKEVLEKTLAWFDNGWNGVGDPPIAKIEAVLSDVRKKL